MKCTKIAEILKSNKLETNFRCGYQTADFNGYIWSNSFVFSATLSHLNGLYVDDVQWKIDSSPDLKIEENHINGGLNILVIL